jgi:hypothetical protein
MAIESVAQCNETLLAPEHRTRWCGWYCVRHSGAAFSFSLAAKNRRCGKLFFAALEFHTQYRYFFFIFILWLRALSLFADGLRVCLGCITNEKEWVWKHLSLPEEGGREGGRIRATILAP